MAYLALYRKYRPRTFDEVVGQETVTRILKNQIVEGHIAHAYLFTGIRGTGKTSIAKIFARAVNCGHSLGGNPCLDCEICRDIEKPGVMDIVEIDGASNRGVDEIRDIREKVKFPPTLGKYKVYIIDEVHMLTKEAFNALLKTLEEPPEHVIFIFATTEINKVPATILSRVQRFDIRPIPKDKILEQLVKITAAEGVKIDRDALEFVAYRGDTSMRDALSLLDQVLDLGDGEHPISRAAVLDFLGMEEDDRLLEIITAIATADHRAALLSLDALVQRGKNPALIYEQLIEVFRKCVITRVTGKQAAEILALAPEDLEKYLAATGELATRTLHAMVDYLIAQRPKLKVGGLATVVVEMALLYLCDFEELAVGQTATAPRPGQPVNRPVTATRGVTDPSLNRGQVAHSQGTSSPANSASSTRPVQPAAHPSTIASPQVEKVAKTPDQSLPWDVDEEDIAPQKSRDSVPARPVAQPAAKETPPPSLGGEPLSEKQSRSGLTPSPAEPKAAPAAKKVADTSRPLDTVKVQRRLEDLTASNNKMMLALILRAGRLVDEGQGNLLLSFPPGDEGRAKLDLLSGPGGGKNMAALQAMVDELLGKGYSLKAGVVQKSYEEMSDYEKTVEIFREHLVEVIDLDNAQK